MGTVLREYETIFVLNPELTEDNSKAVIDRLTDVVVKNGGEVLRLEPWGKRRMSFTVKKHARGNFVLLHYVGPPGIVAELERIMGNLEQVIRVLTTVQGDVTDVEAKKAEVERRVREEAAERARKEQERAERAAAGEDDYGDRRDRDQDYRDRRRD